MSEDFSYGPPAPTAPTVGFDRWLGIISVIAAGLMVVSLWWFKITSTDTGYHLAYGRYFLETGRIVTLDPYLEPSIARPFINANWGSQIVFAIVERAGGAVGLTVLRWMLLSIIFASIAVIVRRVAPDWHWLGWAWMLAALGAYERFTLRPELFSYAIMSILLLVLFIGVKTWRSVTAIGILQIAWVNLHSYFLIGLMMTGSMLAGAMLRTWAAPRGSALRIAQVRGAKMLGAAVFVQLLACFVNPWHVHGAVFPFRTLRYLQEQKVIGAGIDTSGGGPWSQVGEFQPPFRYLFASINYHTMEAYYILVLISLAAIVALFVRRRQGEGIVVAVFLAMSLQMRRNIGQFAMVGAPLSIVGLAASVAPVWSRHRAYGWLRRGLVLATTLAALAWTWQIVEGRFYHGERRFNREPGIGYSARVNLISGAQWLSVQSDVQPRLFVDFYSASNVLPWLDRRFKLLINSNTFAYEDQWMTQIIALCSGQSRHHDFFRRHGVNAALLHVGPQTEPLVRALHADPEWALVYVDPHAIVFLRRIAGHEAIIKTHHPTAHDLDFGTWLASENGFPHHRAMSIATMGAVPLTLGWYEPAAALFEEALRWAPDSPDAWNNLGLCHWHLAKAALQDHRGDSVDVQLREAVRSFEQALVLQPDEEQIQKNLLLARDALRARP